MQADPENAKLRTEGRIAMRRTVIRLVRECLASSTVRRALGEANREYTDLTETQIVRVGKKVGLSPEEVLEIIQNGNGINGPEGTT
jgi:hypothetical protein